MMPYPSKFKLLLMHTVYIVSHTQPSKDFEMHRLYACLSSGNCMKPWLAMNQLGTEFELSLIDVLNGEHKQPAYQKINPLGVLPYMITESGVGIGESNAMLWYLCEDTTLMPPTATGRAAALQWMFFEQSKLEPFISPARFFTTILPDQKDSRAQDISQWQEAAKTGLAFLDSGLGKHPFLLETGYCLADIAVFGYVHVIEEAGIALSEYPNINNWVDRVTKTDRFTPLSDLQARSRKAA